MISVTIKNEIHYSRSSQVSKICGYIIKVLEYLIDNIYLTVHDPKNITYNINDLNFEHQQSMHTRLSVTLEKLDWLDNMNQIQNRRNLLRNGEKFFVDNFPEYTGT